MVLGIKEIQKIIPHRYPFLLVDRVEELEPGKRAVGYKNVTMNEYFFQGHFPEEPVMPGVLQIEALAQLGAIALLSMEEFKGKIAYFGGINKAKFRHKVVPGDVLKLEVEIIKMKGPAGIGKAIATVDGKKAAEAEIMFAVGK
ncbi:3-hydroxyacyl-ACP dehydratase FabZ [Clostridium botulinum]|uniref:3-hydroxyacyl-[acyl-carrier-protein] dehydratase FabZ n=1 Tax=Clostridium botulinum C/D str. DC5 TaxID=1443128 RepID=A0A0A0I9C4_CLOBO|nr:3-hydroxyacyl-ACP dehydratase FabZ [Clostridium botulinum]KEI01949.1 3-hydroxyacyl-ACP dehydratase [Clostridium botulinum C/D str. BKT75002]KEI10051.1 3-hydroxyacyl-ACP dehydratase [Clostridium botulinum C/D str. BKT2873]KGM97497.1 3-hydroxyacyl-ACP dehydratase [Clostridium botulinum C/D str. DC5]KGM98194.1 3-hydroxyacyl-ACP dehydratase [Clostridium botulinum D str. CCUG 7971]KOC50403.1 3-hydroxyacyl-ACP dehydratase [Clostridium botulinum]